MDQHHANGSTAQTANNNNNNTTAADQQQPHNNSNNTMEISSYNTLRIIESRRHTKRGSNRAQCIFYDRTYPGYGWLLPGWIAEERHMDHGRVYKYFYDTKGNRYHSKNEVLCAWEESGLVLLDGRRR